MKNPLFAIIALGLLVLPAAAAPDATDAAVKAYAAQQDAAHAQEINQRIAAAWPKLANDPASPAMGSSQADVTIVEFFDYACPYCKAIEPRLEALLKADRKVRLVLKEFPILTPQSMIATKAALAATKQNKYPAYHEAMMKLEGKLSEDDIFDLAKQSGLDVLRLKRDMEATWITDQIIANLNLARSIRAFQTPTFIVNGREMSSTSASIDFPKEVAAARSAPR